MLVDAGISGRRIENGLKEFGAAPEKLSGVFIPHEHVDHIQGLGVLSRRYHLPIYGNRENLLALSKTPGLGKIDGSLLRPVVSDQTLEIGDIRGNHFSYADAEANQVGYTCE